MQVIQPSSEQSIKKQKSKQDYSRNVKKLKYKLDKISNEIELYQKKIKRLQNTSNDQVIAMKISKFCKQRKFTPEMLFRFADHKGEKLITRSQFRNTLISIGLSNLSLNSISELTQQQFTRLQYLLDEDIKGDISLLQYSKYLHAFGLKQQFSTDDPFVTDTLKKIDFNKMLDITNSDKQKEKKKSGKRILLNYEQFIKYCHKHFPQFTDKQLGMIFTKLSHDYLVDLDDLIDYIQNLKDEQDRINRRNNKEKEKKKQQVKQDQQQQFMKEQQEEINITLLKGKIMAVLIDHPEKQQTFHSSEFKRVQKKFNLQKGQMVTIFRQMDTKMLGSIGYNEIIIYYVDKQTYRPNNQINVKYAFILMGKKMQSRGEKPQTLVEAYTKNQNEITFQEFKKLCLIEFQLKQDLARKLYDLMLYCPGARNKDNNVETKLFISLMKFNRKGMKNNYRPLIEDKFKSFMYKKFYQTICTNGLVTFKLCRSIVQQLSTVEEGHKKWDDPQFGPVNEDLYGFDSIGEQVSNPNIRWLRMSQSKFNQFYIPTSGNKSKIYQTTSLCQSELFYKSLDILMKYQPQFLYRQNSEIVKQNRKIQQVELNKLFQGLHPLIFHQFQVWGIYVIQFFIRNRWVYVLVDDKIPCDEHGKPLFSTSLKGTGSYVSLIEKAYAKLKGSYQKIYQSPTLKKYISQLSGLLTYDINLNNPQSTNEDNNKLWSSILAQTNMDSQLEEVDKMKEKKLSHQNLYLVNQSLCDIKVRQDEKSGLKIDCPVQVYFSTELKQQNSQSDSEKLTLLNCPYEIKQETKWNPKWYVNSKKWKQNSGQIKSQISKWDNANQNFKIYKNGSFNTFIVDYELMNQMFNTFLVMKKIVFEEDDKTIILRKELQFEKNFSCHYKINSTNQSKKVKLIVLLNKIRAPADAKILIQLRNQIPSKDSSNEIKPQLFLMKGDFGCYCFQIPTEQKDLQIKVSNFEDQQQYIYQVTFYFDHPRYSLKERDRQLLFRFVSVYEERSKLDFDILTDEEKKYFYQNYFPNAGRKGFLCC